VSISRLLNRSLPNQTIQFRLQASRFPIANCHAGRPQGERPLTSPSSPSPSEQSSSTSSYPTGQLHPFPWAQRSTVVWTAIILHRPRSASFVLWISRGVTQDGTRAHKAQPQTRQGPCSEPVIVRVPHIALLPTSQDTHCITLQHAYVHLPICSFPYSYYRHTQMMASIQYCPA
jgi:hypothetical protein